MISQCAKCGRFIHGTVADPIITAKSLGWKNYHEACSKSEWARLSRLWRDKGSKGTPPSAGRVPKGDKMAVEKKTQYYVQCILITNGKEESRWHDISDTMKEAEAYCNKQMSPSEFSKEWAMITRQGNPAERRDAEEEDEEKLPALDVGYNMTHKKYVNCVISMILKTGKTTVIEELIHPLAPRTPPSSGQAHDAESSADPAYGGTGP